MEQVVFPADCPPEIIKDRAAEALKAELDRDVMRQTGPYLKVAGVFLGIFVVAAYLHTVAGPAARAGVGDAMVVSVAFTLLEFLSTVLIGGSLVVSYRRGARLQKAFTFRLENARHDLSFALKVLDARLQESFPEAELDAVVEPKMVARQAREPRRPQLQMVSGAMPEPTIELSLKDSCVESATRGRRSISLVG